MSGANSSSMRVASDDDMGSYRSLSAAAVLSLILGLLSFLSFAPTLLFLWVIPPAAIVAGLIALRQITSAPDVWTGIRLAQLGIGLAVVCTGGALGEKYYKSARIERRGKAVADRFMDKLKRGDVEAAFWLTIPREQRAQLETQNVDTLPAQFLERYATFRGEVGDHARELASGEATLEFERIERTALEHGSEVAAVVYRVHSPKGDSRALVVASSLKFHEMQEPTWFIREQRFGYGPGSFAAPVSSGHGHSH